MIVLVTGAAGYIGSHAARRLLDDGHTVVGLDNLVRGHMAAVNILRERGGPRFHFVRADVADEPALLNAIRAHDVTAIMHFAALAYVGESVDAPLDYYRANVAGTIALARAADAAGVDRIVLSSSCATYGQPPAERIPLREDCPQQPISPYGRTKLACEWVLRDHAEASARRGRPIALSLLRYFNVAGCDRDGVLGEHHDPETHLVPAAIHAVLGVRDRLTIFGTDYPTPDGTCVRDYVHVEDLVDAHALVLDRARPSEVRAYNVGTGAGASVREVIDAVARVAGRQVPVDFGPRRAGDPPRLFADPAAITRDLGWSAATPAIDQIVASAWNWFSANPRGYRGAAR